MNVKDIINQIGGGVLSESDGQLLVKAFEDAVETKVQKNIDLKVRDALLKLDEDHSTKLQQLLEAIDKDHTEKLINILEKVDRDRADKLEYIIERNNRILNKDAIKFKNTLVKQISEFMNVYLEEVIPKDQLRESVENKRSKRIIDHIKKAISLDEGFIDKTITEAVKDGRQQIDNLRSELNEALKMNIQLSQQLKKRTSELVLEKNTASLSSKKRNYVMRMLKDKDPEYIKENFEPVVRMFDQDEDDERFRHKEKASRGSTIIKEKIDIPRTNTFFESNDNTLEDSTGVDNYLTEMKNQDRFQVK